jgi:anti-sigma regulatory factor (Ser/Thr protein kinase)
MVQLRQWIRLAAVVSLDPAAMLTLLNRALLAEGRDELATAFVGVVDRRTGTMRYASAGHPPPVVKPSVGKPFALSVENCVPLGVAMDSEFVSRSTPLHDVALLVCYTDGLTEVQRDPIAGQAAIEALLVRDDALFAANPARFAGRLVTPAQARDDVAILTMRIGGTQGRWAFDVGDSDAAYAVKRDFVGAVIDEYGPDANLEACELIFSELIGNVLRYAPGRLSLALSVDERGLWLHVMDDGAGFEGPPTLPADVWSENGRGLFLVAVLAADLVIRRLPVYGTYVKALLPKRT